MRAAIGMHEMFEKVSQRNHKSFLPHGAIFETTWDVLLVGDVWGRCACPLSITERLDEADCVHIEP